MTIAETSSDLVFKLTQRLRHLHSKLRGLFTRSEIRTAGFRRDREPRRHGQAEVRHLSEVCTLAAEEILCILRALTEVIDKRRSRSH